MRTAFASLRPDRSFHVASPLRVECSLFLVFLTAVTLSTFAQNPPKTVMAYFESSGSDHSLRTFANYLNQIPTDTFAINREGNVSGTPPLGALKFARSKGMQTFATVSNFGKAGLVPIIAHDILNHPAIRAKAIQNMLAVLNTYGYSGVNIDFEAVPHRGLVRRRAERITEERVDSPVQPCRRLGIRAGF